jgi:hypothetical protein
LIAFFPGDKRQPLFGKGAGFGNQGYVRNRENARVGSSSLSNRDSMVSAGAMRCSRRKNDPVPLIE